MSISYIMNLQTAAAYLGVGIDAFRRDYMPHLPKAKGRGDKSRSIRFRRVDLEREADKDFQQCKTDYTKTKKVASGRSTKGSTVIGFDEAVERQMKQKQT